MEQDKVRAEFEAWAGGRYGWSLQDEYRGADDRTLASWSGEKYENRIVEGMWQAWQASRAAVVVVLPPCPQPELEGAEEEDMEAFYALSGLHHACRAAIEAAGIRTK